MTADPTPACRVRVLLFAGLREAAGWGERSLTAPVGATPRQLWQQLDLAATWPAAEAPDSEPGAQVRVAINQRFASADTPLADGDELAFLPPISGG
ncbi:MAG: MoaD/ThiS family protein [Synechococcaceae cyanobacterium]|jgi:molybdopterin converting factor subunit 1